VPPTAEFTFLLGDCPVTLLAHRAAVLRPSHSLVLSDTHWGRDHALRALGSPVPAGALAAQLSRLGALLDRIQPAHLFVVGDLIHHGIGLTNGLIDEVSEFRTRYPVPMTLVRGNHDRWLLDAPTGWNLNIATHDPTIDGVTFSHEPEHAPANRPSICGHLHPTVAVGRASNRLKVPCFHLRETQLQLPAFCAHTGGPPIQRVAGDRAFAIAGDRLIEVQ
jgi:DNA ligase-associated metallophosphoesterase